MEEQCFDFFLGFLQFADYHVLPISFSLSAGKKKKDSELYSFPFLESLPLPFIGAMSPP